MPATVLPNDKQQLLYTYGPIDRYLKLFAGVPTYDLFHLLREGLHTKLRAALHKATQEAQPFTLRGTGQSLPPGEDHRQTGEAPQGERRLASQL